MVVEEGGQPVHLALKQRNPFQQEGNQFGDTEFLGRPGQDCEAIKVVLPHLFHLYSEIRNIPESLEGVLSSH